MSLGPAPTAIVERAIVRYQGRTMPVEIPNIRNMGASTGFSHESIVYNLGGTFRGVVRSVERQHHQRPNRGVAGVVGCTNPRVKQDWVHVELVKELIKNDVLVVQTGCSQIALAKAGLYTPEPRPWPVRGCVKSARPWVSRRYWVWVPAWTTAAF